MPVSSKRIVDIHTHILAGVDDGAKSMGEALKMLRIAYEEGITDMIVTPHYQSGRYFTPKHIIQEKILQILRLAEEHDIPIRLYPGTEIYFRSGLEEQLEKGELSAMNGSKHILVEFAPIEEYTYIRNAMEELLGIGYIPILAHVERFKCMREDAGRVKELRKMGCEVQANAGSISGASGFGTKQYLHKLLKEETIDYIGTDAHNASGRAPHVKKCTELLYKKYDSDYVDCVLYKNAENNLLSEE